MRFNAKVALLLLGILVGGVAGYLTPPATVEVVRIGDPPPIEPPGREVPMPPFPTTSDRPGGPLAQQSGRILIFAAVGGTIGLLAGFVAGRR